MSQQFCIYLFNDVIYAIHSVLTSYMNNISLIMSQQFRIHCVMTSYMQFIAYWRHIWIIYHLWCRSNFEPTTVCFCIIILYLTNRKNKMCCKKAYFSWCELISDVITIKICYFRYKGKNNNQWRRYNKYLFSSLCRKIKTFICNTATINAKNWAYSILFDYKYQKMLR